MTTGLPAGATDERADDGAQHRDPGGFGTRTALAVSLVGTAAIASALLGWAPIVFVPAVGGVAGGVALAGGLRALHRWPAGPVGTALAGFASLVVGAGVILGLGGTALLLVGTLFPVPTPADVPTASVRVIGLVGVVAGLSTAAFGAAVAVGGRIEATDLRTALGVSLRTGIVPAAVGSVLLVSGLAGSEPGGDGRAGPVTMLELTAGWILPSANGPAGVVGLLVLALLALVGARGLLDHLAPPRGAADGVWWRRAALVLGVVAASVAGVAIVVTLVGLGAGRAGLTAVLGSGTYEGISALAAMPSLRLVLAAVAGLTLGPTLVVRARAWRASLDRDTVASVAGTQFAGLLVLVTAVVVAEPAVGALRAWVVDKLPGVLGQQFGTTVDRLVGQVGGLALVLLVVAVLVAVAASLIAVLLLIERLGYLAPSSGGVALAAAGLFGATAFAGAVGAPPLLVVGGVITSLLVWDAGRLGESLVRETRAGAPALEGLHLAASLLVGAVGAVVGLAGTALLPGQLPGGAAGVASLTGALVGLLLLLAALR